MSTVYYYLIQDSVPLQSDWITGLSSQGFLSVNNILKDPKTTQEPEHHLLDYSGLDDKTHLEDKIVFEDEHENKNKREFFELGDIRDESSNERNYFSRSDVNPSLLVNKTKFLNKIAHINPFFSFFANGLNLTICLYVFLSFIPILHLY